MKRCAYCTTSYGEHWSNAEDEALYCSRACELLATTGQLPIGMQRTRDGKRAQGARKPAGVLIPAQARTYRTGG